LAYVNFLAISGIQCEATSVVLNPRFAVD